MDTEEPATAVFDLIRIQRVRHQMLANIDLATATPKELRRLLTIHRYESRARTRDRRAAAKLEQNS